MHAYLLAYTYILFSYSILAAWGVANQSYGAAFIYPIYCFLHLRRTRNSKEQENAPLPRNEAKALIITSVIGSLLPLILIFPSLGLVDFTSEQRQGLIALYRVAPILFATIQPITVRFIATFQQIPGPPDTNQSFVVGAYIFAGLYSTAAHTYAMMASLFDQNPATIFGRVFLPSYTHVDASTPTVIVDAAHLFLQYDLIVIGLTFIPYTYVLLDPLLEERSLFQPHINIRQELERPMALLLVILTCVILGPGATVSFAFAVKEIALLKARKALAMKREV
jgi:hypothetical protein